MSFPFFLPFHPPRRNRERQGRLLPVIWAGIGRGCFRDIGDGMEDTMRVSGHRVVTQPREKGFLKGKALPRMFPGRNTRMLMMKDPSQ